MTERRARPTRPVLTGSAARAALAMALCLSAAPAGRAQDAEPPPAAPSAEAEPATRAELIERRRAEKLDALEPEEPSGVEKQLLRLKERQVLQNFGNQVEGVFPKFGGLATGQGLAVGVRYIKKDLANGGVQFRSSVSASTALSQRYEVGLTSPNLFDNKLAVDFSADHRNLARVDFYGLGPESSLDDRTSFRHEYTTYNAEARVRPVRQLVSFGGRFGFIENNTGPGKRSGFPSTEELFSPPGIVDQTDFTRTGGFFEINYLDLPGGARSGGKYVADFNVFNDQDIGRHDFQRLDLNAEQYIPFFNKRRVIALRARTIMTFTEPGQTVPFYMKPWLGGPYALRGFRNYRFFDDHQILMSAEYRWEAFSGLDMALFLDAGKAVPRKSDLDFSDLESGAGVGFRFNIRNRTFLRLDFAFSHEGTQVWFRFGPPW